MYAWGRIGAGGSDRVHRAWRLCCAMLRGLVRPEVSGVEQQGRQP
ncbi:MAG: hypothetical protein AB7O63_09950 [Reyranellaceae bacterium]